MIITVELQNPGPVPGVLLSLSAEARTSPGGVIAAGHLFEQHHALDRYALIPAHGVSTGQFVVPFSSEVIANIEQQRAEHVELAIAGRALVAPVTPRPAAKVLRSAVRSSADATQKGPPTWPTLGPPFETTASGETQSTMIAIRWPRSEWLDHLRRWKWKEVELFEIGLSARSQPVEYGRIYDLLRKAETSFREHDFDATLTHSRRVLESMAKTAGEGDLKAGYEVLVANKITGPKMAADFNAIVKAVTDFSHAGRHERLPHEPVSRSDALVILHMTYALVERLTS